MMCGWNWQETAKVNVCNRLVASITCREQRESAVSLDAHSSKFVTKNEPDQENREDTSPKARDRRRPKAP